MNRKTFMMLALAVSMFCTQITYSQENGLTMDQIVSNLQAFSRSAEMKASANKSLAKMVTQNGVNFALDKDAERILRQNFANDELILAIRKSISEKKSPTPQKNKTSKKARAIEKPTNAEGYLGRAKICNKYDYDCQINNYNKAIEIDPKNAVVYKLRGDSYSRKHDFDQAIINYTNAIEIDPKFFDAYQSRLSVYESKGEFEKAIGDATRVLEIKPKDARVYHQRGYFYRYLLNFEKAIADFSKAIEFEPDNVYFYEDRADTYLQADKYDLAIADYLKKFEVAKTPVAGDEMTHRKLGGCYVKTGQYKKAIDSYTKAIEIDPNYGLAYDGRAEMYEKIGELEKAKADRKKYQELIDDFWKKMK